MKTLAIALLLVVSLCVALVGTLAFSDLGETVHAWSHRVGVCSSEHVALAADAGTGDKPACAFTDGVKTDRGSYSQAELRVMRFIADQIVETGTIAFTAQEIAAEAGISVEAFESMSEARLRAGTLAELGRRKFDFASLAGFGNCSRFSACSIDRDLTGATGAELARYETEKKLDGQPVVDQTAPDFTLPRTSGDTVSLSDYRGRGVALVFLAGHCNHSLETLPVLAELRERYSEEEIAILPIYINSGSVEDVHAWTSELVPDLPVLVAESRDLANAYDFQMVPAVYLVDREGRVTKRLVGQKDGAALDAAVRELIGS